MKKRVNEYRTVTKLPNNAILVSEYALEGDCNTSNIYKHWRKISKGTATTIDLGFEIVLFQNINFVIPN